MRHTISIRLLWAGSALSMLLAWAPARAAGDAPVPGPAVPELEASPPASSTIELQPAAPPRIEGRPRDARPVLRAPSAAAPEPLQLPGDGRAGAVERELQRLMRVAYAGGAYGSTAASAQAAWQLGLIHLHGAGVPANTASAQQWFARAARLGLEPWAFAGLAWCEMEGCAGPPDLAAAERALARLRPAHPARADYLAWLLDTRQSPLAASGPASIQPALPAPPARTPERQGLLRAAAAGDLQANIELGIEAFAEQRLAQSAQYFRRAAARSAVAGANLGIVQARQAAGAVGGPSTAAPAEGAPAQAALAQARKYHRGDGVPANFAEAIRFYRLAEQRGSSEARRMLALIASRPAPDGGFNVQWMQQLAHVDPGPTLPAVGGAAGLNPLQREPTPLFDQLPPAWQRRVTPLAR
ncbi:hypothetical protein PGB34_14715 [Xenophilus arseniciresistens]|uniref:TPR repeat protein n=1 Tax=Xenophilus arseniciresistens TaxID=1283306 RepID=A0AAE3NC41_9BURK|nr:hypothetical protein [Xenophilus arseniciresistens]MDA7417612.1 hypothetical protein [Xenophilus arseniciresistens]